MELKFDMQTYVEREHYFRGYRDCILFLIHCGALSANFYDNDGIKRNVFCLLLLAYYKRELFGLFL